MVKGQYGETLEDNRRLAGQQFVCECCLNCPCPICARPLYCTSLLDRTQRAFLHPRHDTLLLQRIFIDVSVYCKALMQEANHQVDDGLVMLAALVIKIQEAGSKDDIKVPLRVLRDEIGRAFFSGYVLQQYSCQPVHVLAACLPTQLPKGMKHGLIYLHAVLANLPAANHPSNPCTCYTILVPAH